MTAVLAPAPGVDQDVIQEDLHELVDKGRENLVHHSHERCRGVAEPERHDGELKQPVLG